MGARLRDSCATAMHAGQLFEPMGRQRVASAQARPWAVALRRARGANQQKPGKPRDFLIEPRIVFHGARAERVNGPMSIA